MFRHLLPILALVILHRRFNNHSIPDYRSSFNYFDFHLCPMIARFFLEISMPTPSPAFSLPDQAKSPMSVIFSLSCVDFPCIIPHRIDSSSDQSTSGRLSDFRQISIAFISSTPSFTTAFTWDFFHNASPDMLLPNGTTSIIYLGCSFFCKLQRTISILLFAKTLSKLAPSLNLITFTKISQKGHFSATLTYLRLP